MSHPQLYASLIGINAYQGASSLEGCIRDVLNFDGILRRYCRQTNPPMDYHPLYFLAPHEKDKLSIKEHFAKVGVNATFLVPDFENISTLAFDHLSMANGQDTCVFFFSGHGSYLELPEELCFEGLSKQNETIVCKDSRTWGKRDLMDKEISYLLYQALHKKPEVHCLVVMDCCHSGDNTKGNLETTSPRYRHEPSLRLWVPLEEYLGYDKGYYSNQNGIIYFPKTRHIHLAACMAEEKARDFPDGGLFSSKICKVLQNQDSEISYRDLIRQVRPLVKAVNPNQRPLLEALPAEDETRSFLGTSYIPDHPSHKMYFSQEEECWKLDAGSIHGLVLHTEKGSPKPKVRLEASALSIAVVAVGNLSSTIDSACDDILNRDKQYNAQLVEFGIRKLKMGIPIDSEDQAWEKFSTLKGAYEKGWFSYVDLDLYGASLPDIPISLTEDELGIGRFGFLDGIDTFSILPLETDPMVFLGKADIIGKWWYARSIQPPQKSFGPEHFEFFIETFEGEEIREDNLNGFKAEAERILAGETIHLRYRQGRQPFLKFSIALQKCLPGSWFFYALYLDSLYGITCKQFMKTEENKHVLIHKEDEREYIFIPLTMDKAYQEQGVQAIKDHLRIFVSSEEIHMDSFSQSALELKRNKSGKKPLRSGPIRHCFYEKWAVFDFEIRISR